MDVTTEKLSEGKSGDESISYEDLFESHEVEAEQLLSSVSLTCLLEKFGLVEEEEDEMTTKYLESCAKEKSSYLKKYPENESPTLPISEEAAVDAGTQEFEALADSTADFINLYNKTYKDKHPVGKNVAADEVEEWKAKYKKMNEMIERFSTGDNSSQNNIILPKQIHSKENNVDLEALRTKEGWMEFNEKLKKHVSSVEEQFSSGLGLLNHEPNPRPAKPLKKFRSFKWNEPPLPKPSPSRSRVTLTNLTRRSTPKPKTISSDCGVPDDLEIRREMNVAWSRYQQFRRDLLLMQTHDDGIPETRANWRRCQYNSMYGRVRVREGRELIVLKSLDTNAGDEQTGDSMDGPCKNFSDKDFLNLLLKLEDLATNDSEFPLEETSKAVPAVTEKPQNDPPKEIVSKELEIERKRRAKLRKMFRWERFTFGARMYGRTSPLSPSFGSDVNSYMDAEAAALNRERMREKLTDSLFKDDSTKSHVHFVTEIHPLVTTEVPNPIPEPAIVEPVVVEPQPSAPEVSTPAADPSSVDKTKKDKKKKKKRKTSSSSDDLEELERTSEARLGLRR